MDERSTIVAVATPIGQGGLSVVRMSGLQSLQIITKLFKPLSGDTSENQKSHTARYGKIFTTPEKQVVIDDVLVLVMKKPHSYTCEDTVEISCHGSSVIVQKIVDACILEGAQMAEPGEFTKRAFLNGRMDLVQAENVLSLIQSKSEHAYRLSRSHLDGDLSKFIRRLRNELADVLSQIEAHLDFPDDLLEPKTSKDLLDQTSGVKSRIDELLKSSRVGQMVQDGLKIALLGRPNVGKSSLFNKLVGEDRVIVHSAPGTTRDVVEASIQLGGYAVHLMDTAGIRDADSDVEKKGIVKSFSSKDRSDLILYVREAGPSTAEDDSFLEKISDRPIIVVDNKSDLRSASNKSSEKKIKFDNVAQRVSTSCVNEKDHGVNDLIDAIVAWIKNLQPALSDELWLNSVRQVDHMRKSSEYLELALRALDEKQSLEFPSSDIRRAMDELGSIVGELVTDDILDRLFSQFCIGK